MKRKNNNPKEIDTWKEWATQMIYVEKKSGKPFKSGKKVEQIFKIGINPYSENPAFLMEDGTYVDCLICKKYVLDNK